MAASPCPSGAASARFRQRCRQHVTRHLAKLRPWDAGQPPRERFPAPHHQALAPAGAGEALDQQFGLPLPAAEAPRQIDVGDERLGHGGARQRTSRYSALQ